MCILHFAHCTLCGLNFDIYPEGVMPVWLAQCTGVHQVTTYRNFQVVENWYCKKQDCKRYEIFVDPPNNRREYLTKRTSPDEKGACGSVSCKISECNIYLVNSVCKTCCPEVRYKLRNF